ncbi:hypothetical protein BJV78DRAFT_254808 [Lactifluus subvellereus]|nr:hypothetical protein BJV78DRAFT_254808 [Lactifluus subvellereus]
MSTAPHPHSCPLLPQGLIFGQSQPMLILLPSCGCIAVRRIDEREGHLGSQEDAPRQRAWRSVPFPWSSGLAGGHFATQYLSRNAHSQSLIKHLPSGDTSTAITGVPRRTNLFAGVHSTTQIDPYISTFVGPPSSLRVKNAVQVGTRRSFKFQVHWLNCIAL